ncbi:hypothetical protein PQR52_09730 [Paraburkholderia aspalathi]|uniref:hypothetical protein n=1 Tax=Paraburkholderia aspalathi TaxID=1324617 RepID=UPI0038BB880C
MIAKVTAMPPLSTPLPVSVGRDAKAHVDHQDGMLWINTSTGLTIGINLGSDIEGSYFQDDEALGLSLAGTTCFVELPCSREQAAKLFCAAGWNPASLSIY